MQLMNHLSPWHLMLLLAERTHPLGHKFVIGMSLMGCFTSETVPMFPLMLDTPSYNYIMTTPLPDTLVILKP
jgi:hypothetical protein